MTVMGKSVSASLLAVDGLRRLAGAGPGRWERVADEVAGLALFRFPLVRLHRERIRHDDLLWEMGASFTVVARNVNGFGAGAGSSVRGARDAEKHAKRVGLFVACGVFREGGSFADAMRAYRAEYEDSISPIDPNVIRRGSGFTVGVLDDDVSNDLEVLGRTKAVIDPEPDRRSDEDESPARVRATVFNVRRPTEAAAVAKLDAARRLAALPAGTVLALVGGVAGFSAAEIASHMGLPSADTVNQRRSVGRRIAKELGRPVAEARDAVDRELRKAA